MTHVPSLDAVGAVAESIRSPEGRIGAAPPLRVAAVIDTAQLSGPGRQLAALAAALRPRGVELSVVLFRRDGRPEPPLARYLAACGVRCVVLRDRGPLDVGLVRRVRDALHRLSPAVVQTHSYRATALVAALRASGATWRWIGYFHGSTAEDLKVRAFHLLDRQLLRLADRVVVMSRKHAAEFRRVGPSRLRVVYNAVVELPGAGERVRIPADARAPGLPVVGVVGRLSHEKGVDVLLRACALLEQRGAPVSLLVAGDGPDRPSLEALRDALGLGKRVFFLGTVEDVRGRSGALDLLVIPSRSEGLPNVLLEALRAGVGAVATAVGAVPEVLADERAGILVPPGSPEALAEAIVRGLARRTDPAAAAARQEAAERFSLPRRVDAHLALYRELVQEDGAPAPQH